MLKHHDYETVVGHLESIDNNLAALTESVQLLVKNGLPGISAEHLSLLISHLLENVENSTAADPKADKLEPLLDKAQVMEYLDIKDTAYYRWVKNGKLKPRGGKGRHKYFPGDIQKLMEQRKYRKRG